MKSVGVVPGDGVGPEVVDVALSCLFALFEKHGAFLETEIYGFGGESFLRTGKLLTDDDLQKLRTHDAILFGAIGHPKVSPGILEKGILLRLRFALDLYVNLRPIRLFHPLLCPLKNCSGDVDILIVRENTEGLYVGIGGTFKEGTEEEIAIQEAIYTYKGTSRILDYAFQAARKRRRKCLMADKSNVLTFGHGLWRRLLEQKKNTYPDVEARHMYIDALVMQLVRDPTQFDVIVTTNLFGDIISDLGAQLQGGMGMAPSGNIHPGKIGMFEPVHGSAPDIAGQGIANPYAAVLSLAMLLDFLGFKEHGRTIEKAVEQGMAQGCLTKDLGGNCSTKDVAAFLKKYILKAKA